MRTFMVCAIILALGGLLIAQRKATSGSDAPRIFITDSQSWEVGGGAGGAGGSFGGSAKGGARPQTAEIVKTFGERCPDVVPNNLRDKSDYVVILDHEGGKDFFSRRNKVAVFNRVSGDSVMSGSTRSLGNAVQDACSAIRRDWAAHGASMRADRDSNTASAAKPQ